MFQIIASTYGPIELTPYDTNNHKGVLLSGSIAFHNRKEYGNILIQEYATDRFTMHYNEFSFVAKTRLSILTEPRLIQTNVSLKTKLTQSFSKLKVLTKEGQFFLMPGSLENVECNLEGAKEYHHFSIGYQREFIEDFIPFFPVLESLVKGRQADQLFSVTPRWMPREVSSIINQMLHCQYEPAIRDFYFDDKARDLLFYMLVENSKHKPAIKDLSSSDIEKVYACRTIILNDLSEHFNISKLSRKVGLNEFKLKIGFKQLFGVGPFAFLKNERMHKAYDLLLHSDKPIKDIQSIAGYASLTSFVGAFRNFFGRTPGDIRYR